MDFGCFPRDAIARRRIMLGGESDEGAARAWSAHVAAGRIGAGAGAAPAGECRLASLAAILGPRAGEGGAA